MKDQLQPTQIKMTQGQWEFLGKLGHELGYHDGRGDHSRLVREIISAAMTKWLESPYVCMSSRDVVVITRRGHAFYWQLQTLRLNKKRDRLPCSVQIKPEKKQDYLSSRPSGVDEATWFKSRWLLNYFAVARAHEKGKANSNNRLLDSFVDYDGTDSKMADLLVERGPGSLLTREIVVGLEEFVRWRGMKREDDRVGIPIRIPTRNLEVVVILDADLYRATPLEKYEIPNLELEFRNPESARFESEAIARDRWNPIDDPLIGRCIDEESDANCDEIKGYLQELKMRIDTLVYAESSNGPVVPPERRLGLLNAFELPKSFLYFKLNWPSPYFGVEVCVRWERPVKVEEPMQSNTPILAR